MLLKTKAIVFRTYKYGETSLIVELYTERKGLRKYIISGVRSAKARTSAGLLQVMSLVDIVAYEREDKDLNRLKEVRPAYLFQSIPFDVRKGAIGLFMAEIARKAIREREANEPLFNFLFQAFQYLDQTTERSGNIHLSFLLELSRYLGIAPAEQLRAEETFFDLQEGSFVPERPPHPYYLADQEATRFAELFRYRLTTVHELSLNSAERRSLLDRLVQYYQLHLEGIGEIHSHQVLRTVF
jgi:DNA repair protein RecO (recombination protein O)